MVNLNQLKDYKQKQIKELKKKEIEIAIFEKLMNGLVKLGNKISFNLILKPIDLTTLHGALILVLKHPEVQQKNELTRILSGILKKIEKEYFSLILDENEMKVIRDEIID